MRVTTGKAVESSAVQHEPAAPVRLATTTPELPPPSTVPETRGLTLPAPASTGFMRGRTPQIIAHRGGAFEAPENTLAAFRNAVRTRADWSELDVALSRDGQVMVIHDDTVDRTTNGHGRVEDMTVADLRRLDAGRGERLPTLSESLAVPGARFVVELKRSSHPDALADATVRAIRDAGMRDRVVVASFEADLLQRVHAIDPSLPLLGFVGDEQGLAPMLRLPLAVLGVSGNVVDAALRARPEGVAVWAWTIQNPDEARQLGERGVDGIITDGPTAVLRALQND